LDSHGSVPQIQKWAEYQYPQKQGEDEFCCTDKVDEELSALGSSDLWSFLRVIQVSAVQRNQQSDS